MITNFEEITRPLSADENKVSSIIATFISRHGKENPITGARITEIINNNHVQYGLSTKIDGSRVRKIINHLRKNGLAPILSTSGGYFTATPETQKNDVAVQIKSLRERASAMLAAADGLSVYTDEPNLIGSANQHNHTKKNGKKQSEKVKNLLERCYIYIEGLHQENYEDTTVGIWKDKGLDVLFSDLSEFLGKKTTT